MIDTIMITIAMFSMSWIMGDVMTIKRELRERLKRQMSLMQQYAAVLGERIAAF